MRTDDEFYAYVLEKYQRKKQKGQIKKSADSSGNYQYEQPRPDFGKRRRAGMAAAAVALLAGLGVCIYIFHPFLMMGPDVGSSADPSSDSPNASSSANTPNSSDSFYHLTEPVTGRYNGETITLGYLLKTDIKIDNTVSSAFSQGYAVVCRVDSGRDAFCFIDEKGTVLGDAVYKMAYPFEEDGRALVQKEDETWVYIDTTGREVGEGAPPASVNEETDLYFENERFGVQDKEGNRLTEPIFSHIESLSMPQNYAELAQGEHKNVLINGRGEILATLPDDAGGGIRPLGSDRLACAYTGEGGNALYRLMDTAGNLLGEESFSAIGSFENGLALATRDGKVGLIDEQGTVIIPPTLPLDDVGWISLSLNENKCIGSLDGSLVILGINRGEAENTPTPTPTSTPSPVTGSYDGQTITLGYRTVTEYIWPLDNLKPGYFQNGYADIYYYTRQLNQDGQPEDIFIGGAYMDKDGHLLTEPAYKILYPFNGEGIALAQKLDDSWVYVDKTGTETPAGDTHENWDWDYVESIRPSTASFQPEGSVNAWTYDADGGVTVALYGDGKFGDHFRLFDREGNLINETEFDRIGDFYNGLAPVIVDGKMGVIDNKGNMVIEPSLETAYSYFDGYLTCGEDLVIVPYDGKIAVIEITRTPASDASLTREEAADITKEVVEKADGIYYGVLTQDGAVFGIDETQTIPEQSYYCLITDERFRTMAGLRAWVEQAYSQEYIDRELSSYMEEDAASADGPRFKEYNGRLYVDSRAGGIGYAAEYRWDTLQILSQDGDSLTVKVDVYVFGEPDTIHLYTLVQTKNGWRLDKEDSQPFTADS